MVNDFCGEEMKADSTLIKASRNNCGESPIEAVIEEQPSMETPNVTPREEPSLERRKEAASQPLYLVRYE